MRIVIASGKGGTGKTTVAASLAFSLSALMDVAYVDCDVEAPNGHLFLQPQFTHHQPVDVMIPEIDQTRCNACGRCVAVCQFNALAKIKNKILVFQQLCHGCGSCTFNCPQAAIVEVAHPIGEIHTGLTASGIKFHEGQLTISEPMPTPVIRQLKKGVNLPETTTIIFDAPPGASCSVVESLHGADYALLVTEPTPFGIHDLNQVLSIVRQMQIPVGLVINRVQGAYQPLADLCNAQSLEVLAEIPYARAFAEGVARGKTLPEIDPQYLSIFRDLHQAIAARVKQENFTGGQV